MATPGGLDAREHEGSRLNERDCQRQKLVFKERERLDTRGRGQFLDHLRQELLDAHDDPPEAACASTSSSPQMTQPSPNPVGSDKAAR